jgi:two-component system nitrogen regulation sensor histidine kinase GlnL
MLRKPSKEGAAVAALFSPHSVWDEFPNAILIVDHNHQMVVYANPVAEVSLDLSSKLLGGMSLHDLFGHNPELSQMLDAIKTEEVASQRQDLI